MSNESRLKVPVPRRMFLWSLNESSGEVITHIGPTEFTPSANDRVVCLGHDGGFVRPATIGATSFIVVKDGEYVILKNPLLEASDKPSRSNGEFVAGANKERELFLGSTKVIPGPCGFPLWPGQSAEVRQAHKLNANEYLLIEVVGPIDKNATYARLVIESAGLSGAIIDSTAPASQEQENEEGGRAKVSRALKNGQRIVIQGRHTQLFIPPSGIEVVPALDDLGKIASGESDASGIAALSPNMQQELTRMLGQINTGLSRRQFSVIKNELRHRQDLLSGERAVVLSTLDVAFDAKYTGTKRKFSRGGHSQEGGRSSDPYARRAVVLGPKSFCFLFDADGKARIVRGPARVFPGPYDTFLRRGSHRRAYHAYELAEDQALWLRIISPISAEHLANYLPANHELDADRKEYGAGHEMIVRGMPTVFFPFIEAEVIHPITREPHVGNEHGDVILNAVGLDQKSGIYARDCRTGMVRMVRGEASFLFDPRYEEHVSRQVPGDKWNLWIGHAHPHKRTTDSMVETPWALSITIPNNEAVLITSQQGRRVEVGPQVILLEYEEELTPMTLSRGTSKNGHNTLTTCFLHIEGGRVADTFTFRSSDFVEMQIKLGFSGSFKGDTAQEKERWFHVADPIKLLADRVRALLRDVAKNHSAVTILKDITKISREALLPGGEAFRFPENHMLLEASDVLSIAIVNQDLSRLFDKTQFEAVKLQLELEQSRRRVESAREQDTLDAEESNILCDISRRRAIVEVVDTESAHVIATRSLSLRFERELSSLKLSLEKERKNHDFSLIIEREKSEQLNLLRKTEASAEADARALLNTVDDAHRRTLSGIKTELAEGLARADAIRLASIQKELVGALHAAADSEVMKAAAENMNLVALLGQRSPAEIFEQLLRGTPLSRTPQEMMARAENSSKEE